MTQFILGDLVRVSISHRLTNNTKQKHVSKGEIFVFIESVDQNYCCVLSQFGIIDVSKTCIEKI